jgi:shikimate dehydrogenase
VSTAYLIGKPVQHSMSPAMHNAAFAALGLPHRYEAVEVDEADLRATIERWRSEDVLGGNVTIPHKEAVLRMMDEVDDEARAIGAVNTIIRRGSRLVGANTDAYGFARSIEGVPAGGTVLVLGAGGAARACARVLLQRRDTVLVANRSAARAEALARTIEVDGRRPRVVPWPPRGRSLGIETVVNATPLGLHGEDPLEAVELPTNVVDIVPTAEETPLVKRARSREHGVVVDGLAMLLHQAARAFGLWTGVEAPLAVMRAALPRPV